MKNIALFLLIFIFSSVVFSKPKQPWIVDTDMAFPSLGLPYMLLNHNIKVIAISIEGTGEIHCNYGIANAIALLRLTHFNAPVIVICGPKNPLYGHRHFPQAWRNYSDHALKAKPDTSFCEQETSQVAFILHNILQHSPIKISILTLGPLTNIAMLLQQYPDSKNLIKKIVIMGGAIKVPGNIIVPGYTDNLTNHKAEWNLYIDPVADNIVLNSGIPIFLVTLDITNKVPVNTNLVAKISSSTKTPILKTTIKMWQQTLAQHQPIELWDSLAAVLGTNSTIGLYKKKGLAVSIQYKPCNNTTMKATKVAMRAIKKCINQAETGNLIPSVHNSNVFVYESFNVRKFKKLLFSTLNTYF